MNPAQDDKRIGMLIPSSNVVLEPLAARRGTAASFHFSRLGVLDVKLDTASRAQFELDTQVDAAKLLCDAKVNAIIWGGTSASWLGLDRDRQFVDRIRNETGIPASTCVLEINHQLADIGAKRLGMVTPYTLDIAGQIDRHYEKLGFCIAASGNDGGEMSNEFADIPGDVIETMIRKVARAEVDAIVVMCTNMRGADVADAVGRELGIPVIDSAMAALQAARRLL